MESPLSPSLENSASSVKSKKKLTEAEKPIPQYGDIFLYGKLHYSLLESMLERSALQNQQQLLQAEVISPRHLVAVVRGLLDSCSRNHSNIDRIQLALDRLAQTVQVAHSSGCLYGNTRKQLLCNYLFILYYNPT